MFLGGSNRADDPNCSEGGATGLMTLTALRGNNRADDPDCSEKGAIGLMTLIALRDLPSKSLSGRHLPGTSPGGSREFEGETASAIRKQQLI